MSAEKLTAWLKRKHERVCVEARSCTCDIELTEARELANLAHFRYEHPGAPDACRSPHDVLCKAVWP